MAATIRLRRMGARNAPSYRVVVASKRSPRDGRFIETLGYYNPREHDADGNPELWIDPERALHWLEVGAEVTDTANNLLRKLRILEMWHDKRHGFDVSERVAALKALRGKQITASTYTPTRRAALEPAVAEKLDEAAVAVAPKPAAEAEAAPSEDEAASEAATNE